MPKNIVRSVLHSIILALLLSPASFAQAAVPILVGSFPAETAVSAGAPAEEILASSAAAAFPIAAPGPDPAAPVQFRLETATPAWPEHRFWDRENAVLFTAVGAAATADFFTTRSNLASGGTELNPVTRVFASNTPLLATNFALETAGVMGISYIFHRTGHHELERMTSFLSISCSSAAVAYGLTHR